jgi:hypothetical protein
MSAFITDPRKLSRLLILVLTGAAAIAPRSASAWVPIHQCSAGVYARWEPAALPVSYGVNVNGSGLGESATLSMVQACFDHWYEPCCSGASGRSTGATSRSATNNGDEATTIGFAAGGWPAELGDPASTLGVTIPLIWSDCRISEADILFNEAAHDFCYGGCGDWETAFEPVATHEIGHLFGLGHTDDHTAIMYYTYLGGEDGTLRDDDIEGICTIYPANRCGCTGPGDCDAPLQCVDGQCVAVDPCDTMSCGANETCVDGRCYPLGDCAICRPCEDSGPCGANGQCIDRGDGQGRCIQFCSANGSCPGDSVCFVASTAEGDEVRVCVNPDVNTSGLCPDSYVCSDCAGSGCPPGEQCFDGGCRLDPTDTICFPTDGDCNGCPASAEGCVGLESGAWICTAICVTDADCGGCGACAATSDPNMSVCVNNDADTVGVCPGGWTCNPDQPDGDGDVDVDSDADSDGDVDADGDGDNDNGRCNCRAPGAALQDAPGVALLLIGLFFVTRKLRSRREG